LFGADFGALAFLGDPFLDAVVGGVGDENVAVGFDREARGVREPRFAAADAAESSEVGTFPSRSRFRRTS